MFAAGSVVLLEVAVSFLGLGLPGSWGGLIAESLARGASVGPALWAACALGLTVGAVHLLADALSETLDARVATTRRSTHASQHCWAQGNAPSPLRIDGSMGD